MAAIPHSGTIYMPCGTYLVNGPLQQTSGANAILPVPQIPSYGGLEADIVIEGCSKAVWDTNDGTYIVTNEATGNLFGGYDAAPGGLNLVGLTYVKLNLKNIGLQGPANSTLTMVNGRFFTGMSLDHMIINTAGGSPVPTSGSGACAVFPGIGNEVDNYLNDVQCGGYWNGYTFGEHTEVEHAFATNTHNCFVFDVGPNNYPGSTPGYNGNGISVLHSWCNASTNGYVGGANPSAVNVVVGEAENVTNDVYDPNGMLRGTLNILNPYTGSNSTPCDITVVGASNASVTSAYCPYMHSDAFGPDIARSQRYVENPWATAWTMPAELEAVVGNQQFVGLNCHYNGTNWIYDGTGGCGGWRFYEVNDSNGNSHMQANLVLDEPGTSGATVTNMSSTLDTAITCTSGASGPTCSISGVTAAAPTGSLYVAPGTPTVTSSGGSGAALLSSSWAATDRDAVIQLSNSGAIGASTAVATFNLSKPFKDSSGNIMLPACSVLGFANGGLYPLYISAFGGNTTFTISTLPGTSIPGGVANLLYTVHCGGYTQ